MTDHLERCLKTAEVARFEGLSTRWLAEEVKAGRYPPPDFPAERRGAPDRWLESTVQRAREERKARATKRNTAAAQPAA